MLSSDERNLLSVAYKNVVGALRSSWRTINDDENYRKRVESELTEVISEILTLLEKLSKDAKGANDETEVFYLKMTGDYYRYKAEFTGDDNDKKQTEDFYQKAMTVARASLAETHPTRLGLALNFSVCYYEILKQETKACALAKEAFDAAIEKLDTLNDTSYKDSTLIMQLLRDNLTLWSQSNAEEPAPEQPA